MAVPVELGRSTSAQLHDRWPTVITPVGSIEQHGPHLPLDTDTRIAAGVARAAIERLGADPVPPWVLAPGIGYGASGEHQGFAGTISIGTEVLTLLLVEYGRSAAQWAQRLVFVNGHGGNAEALRLAVTRLRAEGRDATWCPCHAVGGDAHAGHTETSLLLFLSATDVRTDCWQPGNSAPLSELMPAMRRDGIGAVSKVGVLGDPTTATAAEGERIFVEMVTDCVRRISAWAPAADGMLT